MTDKRKTDTRERTIHFVIDEISKIGYANISLRNIAKKQDISAAALYRHFQGKDDLLNTVLVEVSHIVYELYQKEIGKIGNSTNSKHNLILFGKTILQMLEEKPLLMDFLFFSPYALSAYQDIENLNTPFLLLKEYNRLVEQLVIEYNPTVEAKTLFIKLWSFIQGYSLLVTNKIVDYDEILLESTLKDMLNRGGYTQ